MKIVLFILIDLLFFLTFLDGIETKFGFCMAYRVVQTKIYYMCTYYKKSFIQ